MSAMHLSLVPLNGVVIRGSISVICKDATTKQSVHICCTVLVTFEHKLFALNAMLTLGFAAEMRSICYRLAG